MTDDAHLSIAGRYRSLRDGHFIIPGARNFLQIRLLCKMCYALANIYSEPSGLGGVQYLLSELESSSPIFSSGLIGAWHKDIYSKVC